MTRLSNFWKFSMAKFLKKVAQNNEWLFGLIWNRPLSKNCCGNFLGKLLLFHLVTLIWSYQNIFWLIHSFIHWLPCYGRLHSSVEPSMPTILLPQAQQLCIFNLYLNCDQKRMKINKKKPGLAHFKKHWLPNGPP